MMDDLCQDCPKDEEGDHRKDPYEKQFGNHINILRCKNSKKTSFFGSSLGITIKIPKFAPNNKNRTL